MKISFSHLPNKIGHGILSLVYPPFCHSCGKHLDIFSREVLCNTCAGDISSAHFASTTKEEMQAHDGSHPTQYYFDAVHSVCPYEGVIRECIHNFKYSRKVGLERVFRDLMAEYAEHRIDVRSMDWIVPVPLHRIKEKERTFNQAAVLASLLAKRFGVRMLQHNLIRIRMGQPQIVLPKQKRINNIRGAFSVQYPNLFKNRDILLVDDVFTTGATANECARVIKEAGAQRVVVFTIARGV